MGSETMTRSIYRSEAGRQAIRAWCELRLDAAGVTGHDLSTSLGGTRVATLGVGPDVVVLPGTNFSTATGLRLLGLVGREHRAIGVDLPGQPGLSAEVRPHNRDAYGVWLREVVDALGLERPVVVGHSLGGRVALLAARGDPSIEGLVLVDPAGLIRVRPAMLATTIRWLVRRDEASSAKLLGRMAAPGADLPAELATWTALVARHVRTSLAPTAPSHGGARRGPVPRLARDGPPRPIPVGPTPCGNADAARWSDRRDGSGDGETLGAGRGAARGPARRAGRGSQAPCGTIRDHG